MKNYALIILFISFSITVFAQNQEPFEHQEDRQSINGLYLAFVPSALVNPWTGYQAKLNYGFSDLIQFQLNGGKLYGKRGNYKFSGYRIRPGVKVFLPAGKQVFNRFYLGVEYNIRKIKEKGEADYARFGGAFIEELPFERITKSKSFILSLGTRSKVNKRLYIESGIGFGVGPLDVTTTQYENAVHLRNTNNFFRSYQEQGEYSMGNLLIHISIGLKLF